MALENASSLFSGFVKGYIGAKDREFNQQRIAEEDKLKKKLANIKIEQQRKISQDKDAFLKLFQGGVTPTTEQPTGQSIDFGQGQQLGQQVTQAQPLAGLGQQPSPLASQPSFAESFLKGQETPGLSQVTQGIAERPGEGVPFRGQSLSEILATPEGQRLALSSGVLNANQLNRILNPQKQASFGGVPSGQFTQTGFTVGPKGDVRKTFAISGPDKPLGINNALKLQNAAGQNPDPNITQRQAEAQGFKPISTSQINLEQSFKSAGIAVDKLETKVLEIYDDPLFKSQSVTGRVIGFPGKVARGFLQTKGVGQKLKVYQDLRKGSMSSIVRSLGEKGALSGPDIDRALGLLPDPNFDSREVAIQKTRDLRHWMRETKVRANIISQRKPSLKRKGVSTKRGPQLKRPTGVPKGYVRKFDRKGGGEVWGPPNSNDSSKFVVVE